VEFEITVIGNKKEDEGDYKGRACIQNLGARVSLPDIVAGNFNQVTEEVDNDHGLQEEEVVFLAALTPEEGINPNNNGHCQSDANNKYQNYMRHNLH